jgi:hypothetical protein
VLELLVATLHRIFNAQRHLVEVQLLVVSNDLLRLQKLAQMTAKTQRLIPLGGLGNPLQLEPGVLAVETLLSQAFQYDIQSHDNSPA